MQQPRWHAHLPIKPHELEGPKVGFQVFERRKKQFFLLVFHNLARKVGLLKGGREIDKKGGEGETKG